MAIERPGGTPEDPNRPPPPDASAHPTGDESRISAPDSGPTPHDESDQAAAAEPPATPKPEPQVNEPAPEPQPTWGRGGHTINKGAAGPDAAPDPDKTATSTSADDAADTAASASPGASSQPDGPGVNAPVTGSTREFATPPTFEMPVPTVETGAPQGPAAEAPEPRRGRIQRQEVGVTAPRPPTVAEARAREKARKRAEEAEQAAVEAEETKRKKKKKVLIGGAAVVGVAALVGGGYLAYDALTTPEVTAYCTVVAKQGQQVAVGNGQTITATSDNQEIVVPDNYCDDAKRSGGGGVGMGGIFILNGSQYRYYYGGNNNTIGRPPSGGTTVLPKGADVKTKSGSTIQRGGLGSKISGGGS